MSAAARLPARKRLEGGTPIGNNAIIALAWCVGIGLVGYLWAGALFRRDPSSSSREVFSALQ